MKIVSFILVIFLLSSCDIATQTDFYINNNTNDTLKIEYSCYTVSNGTPQNYHIQPGELFYVTFVGDRTGYSGVSDYYTNEMTLFSNLVVIKQDTIISTSDFLSRTEWIWTKSSKSSAKYVLNIYYSDF